MLMRYPRSPGSCAAIFACDSTQRRANCSLLIPGLRLRKAISFTIEPPPVGQQSTAAFPHSTPRHQAFTGRSTLALDRPQRQAADQEALQEQGEEDVGDDGHDPHRGDLAPQDVVAARAKPREGVGGRGAHQHGGHHRPNRDDQAVPNTLYPTAAVGREAHGIHIVGEGERLRDEHGWIGEKLRVALKRGQEHPRDRKQEDGEGRDEDHRGQQPATGRPTPHVAIPALTRFWYRRKTWATTVMTTSWMNASADV